MLQRRAQGFRRVPYGCRIKPKARKNVRPQQPFGIRRDLFVAAANKLPPDDAVRLKQDRQILLHSGAAIEFELDADVAR